MWGGAVKKGYSGYRNEYSNSMVIAPVNAQTKFLRAYAYTPRKKLTNLIRLAKGETPISNSSCKEGMIMLRYYDEVFLSENEILSAKDS